MDEAFHAFLRREGRTEGVAQQVAGRVADLSRYLQEERESTLDSAEPEDLLAYVARIEERPKASAKNDLWAIRYYFLFRDKRALADLAGQLRSDRIKSKPLRLRELIGLDSEHLARLEAMGITNAQQMLSASGTPEARAELVQETGIPQETILEMAQLCDLARLPGVKGIRARLYHSAGVKTAAELAAWDPEALRQMVAAYVKRSGFPGVPPLPKEVQSTVANAKKLPQVIW